MLNFAKVWHRGIHEHFTHPKAGRLRESQGQERRLQQCQRGHSRSVARHAGTGGRSKSPARRLETADPRWRGKRPTGTVGTGGNEAGSHQQPGASALACCAYASRLELDRTSGGSRPTPWICGDRHKWPDTLTKCMGGFPSLLDFRALVARETKLQRVIGVSFTARILSSTPRRTVTSSSCGFCMGIWTRTVTCVEIERKPCPVV